MFQVRCYQISAEGKVSVYGQTCTSNHYRCVGEFICSCCSYHHRHCKYEYSKTRVKRPLSKRPQIGFQDQLMQVKCIAEYSNGNILQYFRPSLSYHLSLRSFFSLFLRGRFAQVLMMLIMLCFVMYMQYIACAEQKMKWTGRWS